MSKTVHSNPFNACGDLGEMIEQFTLPSVAMGSIQTLTQGGGLPYPIKQAELARETYEQAVAEMSELARRARKAQSDAMAEITERAQQSVEAPKRKT
ncbi:hypothetical protein WKW79_31690 [Variovorax robiniae]|uniref:Phasin domain-containing protein n=1 Tax=Variovorax robiniae TaxID=1836199 RepID=A0ABU8XH16_9BURK